jgi:hypothetical protein
VLAVVAEHQAEDLLQIDNQLTTMLLAVKVVAGV